MSSWRIAVLLGVLGAGVTATAGADTSKLGKEGMTIEPRGWLRGKNAACCGYPIVPDLGFALRFYWLATQDEFDEPHEIKFGDPEATDIYTQDGIYIGTIPEPFAWSLRMEGSGMFGDGRVVNYTGACPYGYGTCFSELDQHDFPYGRGAKQRPLIPFKSVAVNPTVVKIGEPLYIPEFDGLMLPDGTLHDGCVRADDTGGGIKQAKMDFFVVTYGNFRFLLQELWGVAWVTPRIEEPRCEYLREAWP